MALLQRSLEKFVSKLPLARKEQLLVVAQIHAGEVAYFRLAKQGFQPKGIIDIGASKGDWTRQVAAIFPGVPVLMVEAQTEMKMLLDSVRADIPAASSAICLLGKDEGAEVVFNVMETGSSIYSERSNVPRTQRTITMKTLDQLIREHPKLKAPLFVKLDVQGAELEILTGGQSALASAEVVQLEVALLQYNEGAPLAHNVIEFMVSQGFLLFDIGGFVRPKPLHLAQMDVLFVKKDLSLRQSFFEF